MSIKREIECDLCGASSLGREFYYVQLSTTKIVLGNDERMGSNPYWNGVECGEVEQDMQIITCPTCHEHVVERIEGLRDATKPPEQPVRRWRLFDLDGKPFELGTYEAVFGEVDETDRAAMTRLTRELARTGQLLMLMEVT